MTFQDERFVNSVRKHLYYITGNIDVSMDNIIEAIKKAKAEPILYKRT